MAPMTAFHALLITALTMSKSGAKEKFYYTFNHFQLVRFTFKFKLRITHQNILMAFIFGVATYIVGKLFFR